MVLHRSVKFCIASIIKRIASIHIQLLDNSDWLTMEEEMLFVVEKLAYWPRVVFMVLLFCPVSWRTNPDISRLAEEMAFDGIRTEREPLGLGSTLGAFLKYLYNAIVHWTYELRKYMDHIAVKIFLLKINFANEGQFAKSAKYRAYKI